MWLVTVVQNLSIALMVLFIFASNDSNPIGLKLSKEQRKIMMYCSLITFIIFVFTRY